MTKSSWHCVLACCACKEADLVVLSQDPYTVPPETIAQTRVLTTMVAGKVVYAASSRSPSE